MAAGINLSLVSDVRDFLKGTASVEDALDDVAGSLDDLAREGQRSSDKIEQEFGGSFSDVMRQSDELRRELEGDLERTAREGDTAAEKLERGFRESFDTVKRRGDDAFDDVAKSAKKSSEKAVDAAEEFKDEATQNFSEVASSFSGDMDSAIDLVQGTLGGLAGSIPGVGFALAGLGAAAGFFYNQWADNAEKTQQRIAEMYDDMRASGDDYLSEAYIQAQADAIIKGDEGAIITRKELNETVEQTGLTAAVVARAMAGDAEALQILEIKVNGALEEQLKVRADLEGHRYSSDNQAYAAAQQRIGALRLINERIAMQRDEISQTSDKVREMQDAERGLHALQDISAESARRFGEDAAEAYDKARTEHQSYRREVERDKPVNVRVIPDWDEFDRAVRNKKVDLVGRVRVRGGQAVV